MVTDYFQSFLLLGTIILLIIVSFFPDKPATSNGLVCMSLLVIGLIRELIRKKNMKVFKQTVMEIDFFTLLLLAGLFIVIAGITEAGVVTKISEIFVSFSGGNVFVIYTLIVWASVLFSAFIDNIPYVATMLPVATGIAASLHMDPTLIYFGLIVGATLGGNLTPIGASANIAGLGILRKEGYEVKPLQFMKISVPFTIIPVLSGYILVWIIWS